MNNEPITALTIHRLEEQVQMLKVKVEEINARLENISSIIEEIHPGQVKKTGIGIEQVSFLIV